MEYYYQNDFLKEKLSEDNLKLSNEIIDLLKEYSDKQYHNNTYLRAAHTKTHGLLKAKLRVLEHIPEEFKKGVFSKPNVYDSLIRISNASPLNLKRLSRDFRGLALKVIDVDSLGNNQDFLFTSNPTLTIKSVRLFKELFGFVIKAKLIPVLLYVVKSKSLAFIYRYFKKNKIDTNLIAMSFWTVAAFQLGDLTVKYKIVPRKKELHSQGASLLEKIQNSLFDTEVVYDLFVQKYQDEKNTPIEDISIEWKEEQAPFTKIAELTIPKQHFDKEELFEFLDQINFSPGNSISQHLPLGQINLSRAYVYDIMFRFRASKSNVQPIKVTQELFDNLNYDITRSFQTNEAR